MERGQFAVETLPCWLFVFDGLIAHCDRPKAERLAVRARRWTTAFSMWAVNYKVCDYMNLVMSRGMQVEVLTWHEPEFAELVHDRLWSMGVRVRETRSSDYAWESPHIAVDSLVQVVFDPDPSHRFGYGWKAREL